jgi:hypothetical protein
VHLGPSPQLNYSLSGHGECFQIFDVKRGHISRTLCNRWKHHTTHPLCSCILCIWIFPCSIVIVTMMDVTIIPFAMGTNQSDPLRRPLFALIHFRALHSITKYFPFCLFPSIINNIHIINPPFSLFRLHMSTFKLNFVWGFFIQP